MKEVWVAGQPLHRQTVTKELVWACDVASITLKILMDIVLDVRRVGKRELIYDQGRARWPWVVDGTLKPIY